LGVGGDMGVGVGERAAGTVGADVGTFWRKWPI
jgi:hypothetical protein